MSTAQENFRPLIHLGMDPNQDPDRTGTSYTLNVAVYLPTNYTVISSGYIQEGRDTEFSIYVQQKPIEPLGDFPQPQENLEILADNDSSELNWRVSEFSSDHPETGKITATVTDVSIVLADADDTDIRPVA